ncbi:MAG: hypothetical protein JW863_15495 [Chitinispirillaceae bacterium]|nr:hypothetical protein [Chitinispirillaceae bacterium]
MLQMEHKKGDPDHLDGRVTVFARIDIDPSDITAMQHPIASMVHNGFLVAQGNFKEQNSLKDFLKSEMGLSTDGDFGDGLSELVDRMSDIESALDPQKLKERLENMGEFEEFIPTPAKVVPFHSEMEILSQDGDVFYTGSFKNIGNAVLSVNAVPIVYQARFREQEMQHVRNEIESLIAQIEQTDVPQSRPGKQSPEVSVEERLLKEFIPGMLYSRNEKEQFTAAQNQLRSFLVGYRFPADVDAIISLLSGSGELREHEYKLLEMYARKIAAVQREDFSAADRFTASILKLTGRSNAALSGEDNPTDPVE